MTEDQATKLANNIILAVREHDELTGDSFFRALVKKLMMISAATFEE